MKKLFLILILLSLPSLIYAAGNRVKLPNGTWADQVLLLDTSGNAYAAQDSIGSITISGMPAIYQINTDSTSSDSIMALGVIDQNGKWKRLRIDGNDNLLVYDENAVDTLGTLADLLRGDLSITASALPLPSGAATSANQLIVIDSLNAIAEAVRGGGGGATSANQLAIIDSIAAGNDEIRQLTTPSDTQPVSASALPLPSGAATSSNQSTILDTLAAGNDAIRDLTTPSDTQPISASALPLPSGAATSANQSNVIDSLGIIASYYNAATTVENLMINGEFNYGTTYPPFLGFGEQRTNGVDAGVAWSEGNVNNGFIAWLFVGDFEVGVQYTFRYTVWYDQQSCSDDPEMRIRIDHGGYIYDKTVNITGGLDGVSYTGEFGFTAISSSLNITFEQMASCNSYPTGCAKFYVDNISFTTDVDGIVIVNEDLRRTREYTNFIFHNSNTTIDSLNAIAEAVRGVGIAGDASAANQLVIRDSIAAGNDAIRDLTTPSDTQPISASALPLPSGAATSSNQSTILDTLAAGNDAIRDLTTPSDTQPISASALPLPSGSATSANQSDQIDSLSILIEKTDGILDSLARIIQQNSQFVLRSTEATEILQNYDFSEPLTGDWVGHIGSLVKESSNCSATDQGYVTSGGSGSWGHQEFETTPGLSYTISATLFNIGSVNVATAILPGSNYAAQTADVATVTQTFGASCQTVETTFVSPQATLYVYFPGGNLRVDQVSIRPYIEMQPVRDVITADSIKVTNELTRALIDSVSGQSFYAELYNSSSAGTGDTINVTGNQFSIACSVWTQDTLWIDVQLDTRWIPVYEVGNTNGAWDWAHFTDFIAKAVRVRKTGANEIAISEIRSERRK